MYDLDFLRTQKRQIRSDIKRYLMLFREEIISDFEIELPTKEEIKMMAKKSFDEWIIKNYSIFSTKENVDLQLVELLESFVCVENNITNMENTQSVMA